MASAKSQENVELESFLVTKHSWKGKYKRILTIGSNGIATYNPDKFDLTNRWPYSDIISAAPNRNGNVSLFELIKFTICFYCFSYHFSRLRNLSSL
jgi:DnaJ family protein C protein 13